MASPATNSRVLVALFLMVLHTAVRIAGAANVLVVNNCPFTLWPAATPAGVGSGTQLYHGQKWLVPVTAGTTGARIWARTGCFFVVDHGLRCKTGDCDGSKNCQISGKPPATTAEITVGKDAGALDYYEISVVDGFNVPMDVSSSTGGTIRCRDPRCADGRAAKVHQCRDNSDYQVTFCPY